MARFPSGLRSPSGRLFKLYHESMPMWHIAVLSGTGAACRQLSRLHARVEPCRDAHITYRCGMLDASKQINRGKSPLSLAATDR